MAVDVNQAGNDGSAAKVNGVGGDVFGEDFTEQAVPHGKGTGMEPEIGGENSRVFVKHGLSPFRAEYLCMSMVARRGEKSNPESHGFPNSFPLPNCAVLPLTFSARAV